MILNITFSLTLDTQYTADTGQNWGLLGKKESHLELVNGTPMMVVTTIERDTDRDRHIHIGAAVLQRIPGRLVKEATGIDQGRCGDHRRDPVEEITRRGIRTECSIQLPTLRRTGRCH